jgi:hypothetical protein
LRKVTSLVQTIWARKGRFGPQPLHKKQPMPMLQVRKGARYGCAAKAAAIGGSGSAWGIRHCPNSQAQGQSGRHAQADRLCGYRPGLRLTSGQHATNRSCVKNIHYL